MHIMALIRRNGILRKDFHSASPSLNCCVITEWNHIEFGLCLRVYVPDIASRCWKGLYGLGRQRYVSGMVWLQFSGAAQYRSVDACGGSEMVQILPQSQRCASTDRMRNMRLYLVSERDYCCCCCDHPQSILESHHVAAVRSYTYRYMTSEFAYVLGTHSSNLETECKLFFAKFW